VVEHAGRQVVTDVSGRLQGKNVIANLAEVDDRDQAEALAGANIMIRREQLPDLEEGEYYWSQLIGLSVENTEGVDLGRVDQMIETGANDVLVVQGDRERLIPYVMEDVVKSVDLESQRIVVDWQADF
jgi:16S rRNA processing protein RimM